MGVKPSAISAATVAAFKAKVFGGVIPFPQTNADGTDGVIKIGTETFIHTFQAADTDGTNLFIGRKAGNFTMARDTYAGDASVNLAIGYRSGEYLTKGNYNTFVGHWAGFSNTSGKSNTYIGADAGYTGNVAENCTVIGALACFANINGNGNTVVGAGAARYTTVGGVTMVGDRAGYANTTGVITVVGYQAGFANTIGRITAVGYKAGMANTEGSATIVGYEAGLANTTGYIVAVGDAAGQANTTGFVTAVGHRAALANTTGRTCAFGYMAASKVTTGRMICIGLDSGVGETATNAPVTDLYGILIGDSSNRSVASATELTNYIGIGYGVLIDKSNQVKIGNPSITEMRLYGKLVMDEISAALTDGIPTGTEIDSATGLTPATAGAGYQVTIKDSGGTGLLYRVESDGTDWYYSAGYTKAVN